MAAGSGAFARGSRAGSSAWGQMKGDFYGAKGQYKKMAAQARASGGSVGASIKANAGNGFSAMKTGVKQRAGKMRGFTTSTMHGPVQKQFGPLQRPAAVNMPWGNTATGGTNQALMNKVLQTRRASGQQFAGEGVGSVRNLAVGRAQRKQVPSPVRF
jgi:hypothetical protein